MNFLLLINAVICFNVNCDNKSKTDFKKPTKVVILSSTTALWKDLSQKTNQSGTKLGNISPGQVRSARKCHHRTETEAGIDGFPEAASK